MEHRHHRDGPDDCFGCKVKGVSLTFTAGRDTFHNYTIKDFEPDKEKTPHAERLR